MMGSARVGTAPLGDTLPWSPLDVPVAHSDAVLVVKLLVHAPWALHEAYVQWQQLRTLAFQPTRPPLAAGTSAAGGGGGPTSWRPNFMAAKHLCCV